MRRSKQPEAATASSTGAAPQLTPAALPRVRATSDPASDVPGLDDLERGRTAALIASLGRVQLTLDLIERRLGRLEQAVAGLETGVADVPAQTLLLLDVVAPADEAGGLGEALEEAVEMAVVEEELAEELVILDDFVEVLAEETGDAGLAEAGGVDPEGSEPGEPDAAQAPPTGPESHPGEDTPDGVGLAG